MKKLLIICFLFLAFPAACDRGNKEQLPVDFVWGREVCEKCRMAVSDPHYAVQVIQPDGQAHFFDDIGCAVLWLTAKPWQEKARIWVNDVKTEKWIEAKKANWIFGDEHTPMGYGFAATSDPVAKPLDFPTVKDMINKGKTLVKKNKSKHMKGM